MTASTDRNSNDIADISHHGLPVDLWYLHACFRMKRKTIVLFTLIRFSILSVYVTAIVKVLPLAARNFQARLL